MLAKRVEIKVTDTAGQEHVMVLEDIEVFSEEKVLLPKFQSLTYSGELSKIPSKALYGNKITVIGKPTE